ncbi:MAG: flavodoxin family protein [Planctomycetota bacterium]
MRILALNGSPRRERSNTQRLLGPMLDAAREEGAEVEHRYLKDLDIRPCTGCFSCWTATPGRCVQDDDMAGVLEEMLKADALVLAFPLYVFGVPAGVAAFLERIVPVVEPWLVREGEVTGHPLRHPDRQPRWVVLSNCGFPEQSHFDAVMGRFAHVGARPIVMAAGEFLPVMERTPELAEALEALRAALAEAGRELARTGAIPEKLHQRLSRPVIEWAGVSADQYVAAANEGFRRAVDAAERRRKSSES